MNFTPLISASPAIQIHAICAIIAFALGPFILNRRKGTRTHKIMGYIWVSAMGLAITSSWFIHSIPMLGPFGPIHILSAFSTIALIRAIQQARRGNIAAHRGIMRGLYFGGLGVAGLFTFLPGRIMNRMVFPSGYEWFGFGLVAAIGLVVFALITLRPKRRVQRPV